MEISSRPLAVESFSESWLSNAVRVPSLANSLEFDESFDFDTPNFAESQAFVHADELFSNGLIKPSSTSATADSTVSVVSSSRSSTGTSEYYSRIKVSDNRSDDDTQLGCSFCFFRRRRKYSSEQILKKMYGYLRPTTRRFIWGSKKSTKVDDIDRRRMEVRRSWSNIASPQTSPGRPSTVYVDINESSIYEAVLHCKRSIGK
ncbi:membrane-associated kinase regulator [Parasponia andersonii]|uniref:Membrane-associated kinase regulator n=1 Tax=Parasponia andersonii TaxID=3476 RepID=A0A2P5BLK5_PARAD|nr:membrane-associated kinase regulator [Parasponia andersonii]